MLERRVLSPEVIVARRTQERRRRQRSQVNKLKLMAVALLLMVSGTFWWVDKQLNRPPAWLGLPKEWQDFSSAKYISTVPDALALQDLPEGQEDLALKEQLSTTLGPFTGRLSPHVYYLDLKTGQYVNINGTVPVPAASVIKIPLLMEYYRARTEAKILASQQFFFSDIHQAGGSGDMQYKGTGKLMAGVDVAKAMIQISDNSATNMFIDYLGGMSELNDKFRRMGLQQTYLRNWLPDLSGTNVISQRDMAKILYNVAYTDYLCPTCKQEAIEILKGCHNNRLIPAGLPQEVPVAHKTGDIGTSLGDSALVMVPGGDAYLLSIQVERPYNDYTAKELIIEISRQVYAHHQMNSALATASSSNQPTGSVSQ